MRVKRTKILMLFMIIGITILASGCNLSKTAIVFKNSISETPKSKSKPKPIKLVNYTGPIRHIFFHSLIAFHQIAVDKGTFAALSIDCVTVTEFKRALEELYKNDYILIDINSTYEVKYINGIKTLVDKKLILPEGKKPLIMSIDDMVYDPKKMGDGMVDKIIIDENGNLATYTKNKDGSEVISNDNEVIPILDKFVENHLDFSFKGAKATLAVTGWVGILGYRIDRLATNRQSEIAAVIPIVKKLKKNGWNFASHSYGHRHEREISYSLFKDDLTKWKNEIEPIVGATDIYVYPYGEPLPINDSKYKLILQYGFKVMCGVGSKPYWKNYGNSIDMDRISIDGYSLINHRKYISPLFDTLKVLDDKSQLIH